MKISWKNIENWQSWKMRFFWGGHFEFFKSAILNFFFASYQWKTQPIYMRYHFFLHYGWFFQILGKEAVRTFMHTTVHIYYFFKIKLCHSFWFTVKFAAWTFNSKLVGATIIYHVRDGSRTATVPWPRANNFWIIMKKIIKIGRKWKKKKNQYILISFMQIRSSKLIWTDATRKSC